MTIHDGTSATVEDTVHQDLGGWGRRRWTWLLGIPVVVVAVIMLGVFAPAPLALSAVGAAATSAITYLVVVAVLLAGLAALLVIKRRTASRLTLLGLALVSVIGSVVVGTQQLTVARDNDIDVSLASTFRLAEGDVGPDETVVYTTFEGEDVPLSIWRPQGKVTGSAPVIFMVHGGGWVSGASTEGAPPGHASWFAEHGYLVVSADYSLSSDERHLWDVVEGQIGCAMAWTAENAAQYGGDVSRLGLVGDSAGGNLVLQAAYKGSAGELVSSCGGEIPAVRAISALYPAVDMEALYAYPQARTFTSQYLGGTPQEVPGRFATTSPTEHVIADAPPTLLTLGRSDHLVPPETTRRFSDQLQEAGVTTDLIEIPHGEHVFDWAPGSIGSQVFREATLRWMTSHGV